jgi:hypothetical protein
MPDRDTATPVGVPHTRHIDLSNGQALPAIDEPEDNAAPALETDDVTIIADRANDLYEASNRGRFKTHVASHRNVIDPVENAYMEFPGTVAPGSAQFCQQYRIAVGFRQRRSSGRSGARERHADALCGQFHSCHRRYFRRCGMDRHSLSGRRFRPDVGCLRFTVSVTIAICWCL